MSTVLVTGSTAGIGRETALTLARKGHRVFATGRRQDALDKLAAEASGTKLETVLLDVTSSASIDAAREEVDRRTDGYGVDVLINNAGYALIGPADSLSDDDLRKQFDTNVFGLMAVTRAFVPAMRARRSGRVINISSFAGRVTFPMMGAYHASKYALEALSDALRNELALFNVFVVLVEPGFVHTEFTERALADVNRFEGGPYGGVIRTADEVRHRFESTGVAASVIVRAIERAMHARSPAARYLAPLRMHLLLLTFRILPTRITDVLLRFIFGIRARALPAAR